MKLGIDNLIESRELIDKLKGPRLALLAHQASLTSDCRHTLDVLMGIDGLNMAAVFSPQHGMYGAKQDNMVESEHFTDPKYGIPIFSLYSETRVPSKEMMDAFDILLVDLQDVGTRIYTYLTTIVYFLKESDSTKQIFILDRPNPAGRPVEGTILEPGWESFVGPAQMMMRHGLTLGEFALWYVKTNNLKVNLTIIPMVDYNPDAAPGYGWPLHEISWTNPSPNASSLNMARCYPGTVLIEGTTLSEGRGTTTPLEMIGAPDIDFDLILNRITELKSQWVQGCFLRSAFFEPTFQKHTGKFCSGIQILTDNASYQHHKFKPYRLIALIFKAIRMEYPDYKIWREFAYEYETERLAIDLLGGGTFLREWVDDPNLDADVFDARLKKDEQKWMQERKSHLLY